MLSVPVSHDGQHLDLSLQVLRGEGPVLLWDVDHATG